MSQCKLETSHELLQGFRDLRVEAIITEVKPRLLWLQLKDSKPSDNEGRSLTGLENDASRMQADLHQPLWVHLL